MGKDIFLLEFSGFVKAILVGLMTQFL